MPIAHAYGGTGTGAVGTTIDLVVSGAFGGAKPKLAVVYMSGAFSNNGASDWLRYSVGFTDGVTQASHSIFSRDANGSGDTARTYRDNAVVSMAYVTNQAAYLYFDSWTEDGVRLKVGGEAFGGNYRLFCVLYGGEDIEQVAVVNAQSDNTTSARAINFGFEPDMVYAASICSATAPPNLSQTEATLSYGICLNDGNLTQHAHGVHSKNISDPMTAASVYSDTSILSRVLNDALSYKETITSFTSTGIEITSSVAHIQRHSFYAVKFSNKVQLALKPIGIPNAAQNFGGSCGFKPYYSLIHTLGTNAANDVVDVADVWSAHTTSLMDKTIGYAYPRITISNWEQDAIATTNSGGAYYRSSFSLHDEIGSIIKSSTDWDFIDEGFEFTGVTQPNAGEVKGFFLSVGLIPSASGIPTGYQGVVVPSRLLPRQGGSVKPVGNVEIDWNNPYSRVLRYCFIADGPRLWAPKSDITPVVNGAVPSRNGFYFDGSNDYVNVNSMQLTTEYTVIALVNFATGSTGRVFDQSGGGGARQILERNASGGLLRLYVGGWRNSSFVVPLNQDVAVGWSREVGGNSDVIYNGEIDNAWSTSNTSDGVAALMAFQDGSANNCKGTLYAFFVFNKKLSVEETRDFCNNPYQFLREVF